MLPFRYLIFSATLLLCSCARPVFVFEPSPATPTATSVSDIDLAYFLAHFELLAQSQLSHKRGQDISWDYRILANTKQGSCVGKCPPTLLLIALSNYNERPPEMKLFRISGLSFASFGRVVHYGNPTHGDPLVIFTIYSRPHPQQCPEFRVSVWPERATIVPTGNTNRSAWCQ
jgi:hypothetical protein